MRRLRLNISAKRNLREIGQYIFQESGSRAIAIKFVEAIGEQCSKLASLDSELGRLRPGLGEGVRSVPFRAYVIFFRYHPEELEVINVLSGRRDIDRFFEDADD